MDQLSHRLSRRVFTATAAGFAAGIFVSARLGARAQDATPATDVQPLGYIGMRVRVLRESASLDDIDDLVIREFVPQVEALDGFQGYLFGDVVDHPDESLSIVIFDQMDHAHAFDEVAAGFVASLGDQVRPEETRSWAGDLLIAQGPATHGATPSVTDAATPVGSFGKGFAKVRMYTSKPGTDPRDVVLPLSIESFLPFVTSLRGFLGYLWFPTDQGFVAVTVFDSAESADGSTDAAREWADEHLAEHTEGEPEIFDVNLEYSHLPILAGS